jgi:hypothetical protein
VAELTQLYGSDFAGADDLDPLLTVREGVAGEALALGESLARRLATPRGALWYSPNDGFDVRSLVADTEDPSNAEDKIELECLKDERVRKVKVTVTVTDPSSWEIAIVVTPKTGATFRLTLAVSKLTVQLLKVG